MREAPLARHLARFSGSGGTAPIGMAPIVMVRPVPVEPKVTVTEAEMAARLERAATQARDKAAAEHEAAMRAAEAAHAAAMTMALTEARAEWVAAEADRLDADLATATGQLREIVTAHLGNVLRHLLPELIVARAIAQCAAALDQLLADPDRPAITVSGPADLVDALRAARGDRPGITFAIANSAELTIQAADALVETRLAAALAAVAGAS